MRALLKKIRRAFSSGTLIDHYFRSKSFRVSISLLLSLALNIVYLIFNLASGIKYGSIEFIAVAMYYALHICIRYIILKRSHIPLTEREERSACKRGGLLLLFADVLITPMLILGAFASHAMQYSRLVLIFLGVYAASTLISATVGIVVSGRENIPMRRAAYCVKLASGAVSGFNLASALLANFISDESASETLTVIFGIIVFISVLCLSFIMIFSTATAERSL